MVITRCQHCGSVTSVTTIGNVKKQIDSMTKEQQEAMYYLIGRALDEARKM